MNIVDDGSLTNDTAARPLTVSQFIEQINVVLAEQVVWVEGEVCDLHISQGKWMYFSLKDDSSLVNCFAMVFRVRTPIEEGMKVKIWGVPRIYAKFGKFSINVDSIEPSGEGALKRAFELLKNKLEEQGLFALERKRKLPRFPEKIGLITSSEAAAYSDFLKVLKGRRGGIEINFISVAVQGRDAAKDICGAIQQLNEQYPNLDVLVLVRGGGSLEDLHAFNDEDVVRALARSRIPSMTGVGHERDVTLVDYVADVRGSTPSNCAELLTPTREEIDASLNEMTRRLSSKVGELFIQRERSIVRSVNIIHDSVTNSLERVQNLAQRMSNVGRFYDTTLQRNKANIERGSLVINNIINDELLKQQQKVDTMQRVIMSLHPKNTLARGYSITKTALGKVVRDSQSLTDGEKIETVLHRGIINSIVNLKSSWHQKTQLTSPKHTKSLKKSSRSSKQATLI
jgi:exodeoxyribonuclease VII large subunit